MNSIWEFVERYYPKYSSCDSIAYNNDLECIIDREFYDESSAKKLYLEKWEEFINSGLTTGEAEEAVTEWAKAELIESNEDIYERAIQGYIDELNKSKDGN